MIDQLVAEALDVHGATAGKMQQRLLHLRGADEAARAARDRLIGKPHDRRAAFGALPRHDEFARGFGPLFHEHAHDLGNHVASATRDHGVADAHVLASHFILVVQRGVGDGDAADEDGLEPRDRRERAGAPDLDIDAQDLGCHLLGGKLVRQREARRARDESQRRLLRESVDLVDDAIDLERQRIALCTDTAVITQKAVESVHDCALARDRQAERFEEIQYCRLRLRRALVRAPIDLADPVGKERQFPAGGHFRIKLAQTASRRIARIDERPLAFRRLRRVEPLEVALEHQHLTAHLEIPRKANLRGGELERECLDCPQVGGDVFANVAVAPRRAEREQAGFVNEPNREPIEFRLDRVRDAVDAQRLADATVECARLFGRKRVVERKHRNAVRHRLELCRRRSADTLCRRVWGRQRGMLAFERLQLAK